jgi:hypothetical protein
MTDKIKIKLNKNNKSNFLSYFLKVKDTFGIIPYYNQSPRGLYPRLAVKYPKFN